MNLILRTMERIFRIPESQFCSEDLAEVNTFTFLLINWFYRISTNHSLIQASPQALCAYFAAIFLVGFQFRQHAAAFHLHVRP